MIVLDEPSDLLLITQGDHAHLAVEILSLCRIPELLEHPRRRQLLTATREHDNGWRESDAAPLLDPLTGWPHSFLTLPGEARREIWRRACSRFRDTDPYIAALVTQHALEVHRERTDRDAGWADWFGETRTALSEHLEDGGYAPETLKADYPWLRLADLCSLAACGTAPDAFEHHGFIGRAADRVLRLDPLPLAGSTSFSVACRRIPRRAYASATDLTVAMASARWDRLTVRVNGTNG